MLNDHPYIQQNSRVQNKYSIPTNLSQQLNQQSGQDYKTPQWNINTTQNKPQEYSQQQQQYRFEQPQFQESYDRNIGRNHQRNPYLPSFDSEEEQDEQYQQDQQQYQQQEYNEYPREYYEEQQPIYYPPQPIDYPPYPIYLPPQIINSPPPPIYYPLQPIQTLPFVGVQYKSYFKENSKIRDVKGFPFREDTLEDKFDKGLINIASHQKELENAKLSLCVREDFRIGELFILFDQNGTGSLMPEELMMGLGKFNLQPQIQDSLMLFEEYGLNRSMDLQQFGDMIYPMSISNEMTKCNNNDRVQMFPETKLYVRKVFVALLNAENAIQMFRNEIIQLNLEEMHQKIFLQDHLNDLKNYIYQKGQYFDKITIQGLFKRLDRNYTKSVSLQEFQYFFSLKNYN